MNKPKSRTVQTECRPIVLPFYAILVSYFSFTYQGANAFFIKGQTFPQQVEVGQKNTSIKHYIKHRLKGQSRL